METTPEKPELKPSTTRNAAKIGRRGIGKKGQTRHFLGETNYDLHKINVETRLEKRPPDKPPTIGKRVWKMRRKRGLGSKTR